VGKADVSVLAGGVFATGTFIESDKTRNFQLGSGRRDNTILMEPHSRINVALYVSLYG
jgi:hypothetical protein